MEVKGEWITIKSTDLKGLGYCSALVLYRISKILHEIFLSVPDFIWRNNSFGQQFHTQSQDEDAAHGEVQDLLQMLS